ncbi:hypothetical protein C8D95_11610 [Silicimonas algicola]|uniref:Uncharacterized protein n=1 Tax=Silicimonas algicola TaxID=1826607 RepID=A0A316FWD3_9RHOB|nr:hypothetical protein C8D95_11610 [Silicimonas algicola]
MSTLVTRLIAEVEDSPLLFHRGAERRRRGIKRDLSSSGMLAQSGNSTQVAARSPEDFFTADSVPQRRWQTVPKRRCAAKSTITASLSVERLPSPTLCEAEFGGCAVTPDDASVGSMKGAVSSAVVASASRSQMRCRVSAASGPPQANAKLGKARLQRLVDRVAGHQRIVATAPNVDRDVARRVPRRRAKPGREGNAEDAVAAQHDHLQSVLPGNTGMVQDGLRVAVVESIGRPPRPRSSRA